MAAWFCHDLREQPERGRQPLVNWYFRRRRHSNGPALSTGLPQVCKTKVRIVLLGVSLARGWRCGKACTQNRCHWEYRAVSDERRGARSLSGIDSAEAPNMTAFPEGVWA